jgi:AcrR family transcriptional regulator
MVDGSSPHCASPPGGWCEAEALVPADLIDTGASAAPRTVAGNRKEQTQDRIVRAAIAVFADRGYERASISAIASRAQVSRSAVFWHFSHKEGLFREAFGRMLVPFFEELQASLELVPPHKRVFEMFDAYERVVDENAQAIRSIVRWLFESEDLRSILLDTLFRLHDALARDVRDALYEIEPDSARSAALGAAFLATLDGNLLLSMLDPNASHRELRRSGLRELARLAVGEDGF